MKGELLPFTWPLKDVSLDIAPENVPRSRRSLITIYDIYLKFFKQLIYHILLLGKFSEFLENLTH